MHVLSLIHTVTKFFERGICDNITNENLNDRIYYSSLLIGLDGYRNYSQAAKMLCISKTYLYFLISNHKDIIGEPFHNPILGQNNWLSLSQIKKLEMIIKCHSKEKPLH